MLSREQIEDAMKCETDMNFECKECKCLAESCLASNAYVPKAALALLDKTEALLHENEQIGFERDELKGSWKDKCGEIEQLKAQNAEAIDTLQELHNIVQGVLDGETTIDSFTLQPARQILSGNVSNYHNPQDVETLKMAKEALKSVAVWFAGEECIQLPDEKTFYLTSDAVEAIDKVLDYQNYLNSIEDPRD